GNPKPFPAPRCRRSAPCPPPSCKPRTSPSSATPGCGRSAAVCRERFPKNPSSKKRRRLSKDSTVRQMIFSDYNLIPQCCGVICIPSHKCLHSQNLLESHEFSLPHHGQAGAAVTQFFIERQRGGIGRERVEPDGPPSQLA